VDNSEDSTKLSTGATVRNASVLLIFAKQPLAGQVKTRLTPDLTPCQAATLYAFSLRQTIAALSRDDDYDVVICYSGERSYFAERYPQCQLVCQGQGDLGQRLKRMFHHAIQCGWQRVCVVGTDSPDLPRERVLQAFKALEDNDFVVVPAEDGGYVLAGASDYYPTVFEQIDWSSERVLEQTRTRLVSCQLRYHLLPPWEDIDDVGSLRRYAQRHADNGCSRYALRCLQGKRNLK